MKLATVVFLKKDGKIILSKKKQHIHVGEEKLARSKEIYNGFGGKFDEKAGDKDIEDTAIRELNEETGKTNGVFAKKEDLIKIGEIQFFWPNNNSNNPNMFVYFYLVENFVGYPVETDEMGEPEEFFEEDIPYNQMTGADKEIIPKMLKNKDTFLKAKVFLLENNEYEIIEEKIENFKEHTLKIKLR